jgi:nicotinamidase/pyrazinamidase
LGLPGFGELAVPEGEKIVRPINQLLTRAASNLWVFTTQDWHPRETAHFSEAPNFQTNWPVHCVADTAGAALHPGIVLPDNATPFYKGQAPLLSGEDDTSYSGWNSSTGRHWYPFMRELPSDFHAFERVFQERGATEVYLGGLAFDYCVGATALDIREKADVPVTVIEEATRAITPESEVAMREKLRAAGVRIINLDQAMEELQ